MNCYYNKPEFPKFLQWRAQKKLKNWTFHTNFLHISANLRTESQTLALPRHFGRAICSLENVFCDIYYELVISAISL